MPVCTVCNKTKPRAQFYPRKGAVSGITNKCRDCIKAYSKAWWAEYGKGVKCS